MSKHTPGPWNDEHATVVYYAPFISDAMGCTIIGNNKDATENDWLALIPVTTPEDKANARLIAAAPDLLAALQKDIHHIEQLAEMVNMFAEQLGLGRKVHTEDFTENARQAIARATGE